MSVIDVPAGPQPIFSEDGRSCIVFNGEVYNHAALRRELRAKGVRFRTRTDTEVALQAFRAWGGESLQRLRGMFAFAVWDMDKEALFLARDRLGIKPLYHTECEDGTFIFASEIKALLAHPAVTPRVNPQAVDQLFTFGFHVAPHTFFKGVEQLLPGHCLTLSAGEKNLRCYWDVDGTMELLQDSETHLVERFREKLQEGVELGMVSDVPVGVYLSGGIDSTAIASLAAPVSRNPLRTLSITFDEAEYDERNFSRMVASALGAEHHEFQCSVEEEDVVGMIRALENPIVSLLHLPLFLLSREARNLGLKVILTGDGSDEILGGYDYFQQIKCMEFTHRGGEGRWRRNILKRLYPSLEGPGQVDLLFDHLTEAAGRFPLKHPAVPYRYRQFQFKEQLYSNDFASSLPPWDFSSLHLGSLHRFQNRPLFDQAIYLEMKMRLLNLTLPLADKMAMVHSVEVRPLFLDHELVELLFQIPPHLKMRGLNEKFLLKEAMRGLIPEKVRTRKKQPFNPPAPWFLRTVKGLVEETLIPRRVKEAGYFDPSFVQQMLHHFQKGKTPDLSGLLVVIFFVQLWHQVMIEGRHEYTVENLPEEGFLQRAGVCP